jgi:hypothetical protein
MNVPAAGWGVNYDGNPTYTVHGPSFFVRPPQVTGFYAHWISRFGVEYTTWSYRPVVAKAEVTS